jgi:signal transduction histidine kinase
LKEYRPDLVLADVMMPGMDGFELLQALRSDPDTRTLPVILLSARAGEEAQVEGMAAGADDYLIKPFSARELLARIGGHLEMARLRKEAEERVNMERQRLYDLFMQAPALFAVLRGPDHVFELANPMYLQAAGQHRDILGKSVREAFPELEEQGFVELLDTVYQTGKPYVGNKTLTLVDRKGNGTLEEMYFNFVYQPLRNARDEIEGILYHGVDITDQKRAEDQLKESIEHLKQLEQHKDVFLGIVSHELKTPVTSLKVFTEVLQHRFEKAGDEKTASLLGKMTAQVDRLIFLIGDLLDVTKIVGGKLQFHEDYFAFDALVDDIIEEVQRTSAQHAIERKGTTHATVYGDRERIGQVITNLLTNAIKYSPNATSIVVTSASSQQDITLCVQDFGIGIAKDKQSQVFERFFRETGTREDTFTGLGLGLYVSAEIIQRQGGKIWVESEKGRGSTFCFTLPLQGSKDRRQQEHGLAEEDMTHE